MTGRLVAANVQVLGDLLGDSLVMAVGWPLVLGDLVDLGAAGVNIEEADGASVGALDLTVVAGGGSRRTNIS